MAGQSLKKLPDVHFPAIYQHFMEKSLVVSARMSLASVGDDSDAASDTEIFSSFKGIEKGSISSKVAMCSRLRWYTGMHSVLLGVMCCHASMKKYAPYKTKICLLSSGKVKLALCTCTAGLAGCCNHVAALLYALEEFVRFGLHDEEESPTSRLCK